MVKPCVANAKSEFLSLASVITVRNAADCFVRGVCRAMAMALLLLLNPKVARKLGFTSDLADFVGILMLNKKLGENLVIRYILPIHLVKAQNHLHQIVSGMLLYL